MRESEDRSVPHNVNEALVQQRHACQDQVNLGNGHA